MTTPDANVKDTFEVACKSGEPLTESRMASIRTAIVQSAAASPLKASTATVRRCSATLPRRCVLLLRARLLRALCAERAMG